MTEIAVAHRESTTPDGVLVQEAAAGSGVAYGELYDRHAAHVYNYSLRLTGSPEDAADATQEAFLNVLRRLQDDDRPVLDFSAYLFAAARNESYALMRRRSRVQVSDTPPEDPARRPDVATEPERAVLMRDSQEQVRSANAKLPPRHREVLALRELGGRSYDEIGRIMGISENGAAQLIWRARSKLREAMTAGAVASVVATSIECERAQMLLGRIQDGEPVDELDRAWLDLHLDGCGSCRSARGMLLEVGAFYAAWMPVAAIAGLKAETLTAAGGVIGADWSGVASGGSAGAGGGGTGVGGGAIAAAGAVAAVGAALAALLGGGESSLDRQVRERVDQPAAASEPAPARAQDAASAAGMPAAAAGAQMTAQRALRAAPGAGPGGDVDGFTEDRPRAGEPRGDGAPRERRDGARGDGPRDTTPAPPAPSPLDTPGPPGGPAPPDTNPGPPRDGGPTPPSPPKPDPPRGGPPPGPGPTDPPGPPPPPPPPPPEGSSCTWPGGGGGPGGCPPGHGGVPPGQGGEPPGQVGRP